MPSNFFSRHGGKLLLFVALTLPLLVVYGNGMPRNNEVETWLPKNTEVHRVYEDFKENFGREEAVLIALETSNDSQRDARHTAGGGIDDALADAVSIRIANVPGVRACWSPGRLEAMMTEYGLPADEAARRMEGFLRSRDHNIIGMAAQLSEEGERDRDRVLADIQKVLDYCLLDHDGVHVAGVPVLTSELDRLSHPNSTKKYVIGSLLLCAALLYWQFRDIKLTAAITGLTIWAICCALSIVRVSGGEMNMILGSLSVMVMVFTLSIIIHIVHYERDCRAEIERRKAKRGNGKSDGKSRGNDALIQALCLAAKPCCLASLTTAIGLVSLSMSEIAPVRQFGWAAAVGCFVSLFTGFLLTPAAIAMWPPAAGTVGREQQAFERVARGILAHPGRVVLITTTLILLSAFGMPRLESRLEPLDFIPAHGQLGKDTRFIRQNLTSTVTIEAVVNFGDRTLPKTQKIREVRRIASKLAAHPAVYHTMSAAMFLPEEPSIGALSKAESLGSSSGFVSSDGSEWRISARVETEDVAARSRVFEELSQLIADEPVVLTGVTPLLDNAQYEIFRGFWQSFATAFAIISVVMILSLRSLKIGVLAMIPNLTPICLVFGVLGWLGVKVDIGMMMTGSIALGIAVDGTFHFLVRYNECHKHPDGHCPAESALMHTGMAILQAAMIASAGMLALMLSDFSPMFRFGMMMSILLMTALIGDLVLLPAVLACIGERKLPEPLPLLDPPETRSGPTDGDEDIGFADDEEDDHAEGVDHKSTAAPSVRGPHHPHSTQTDPVPHNR